jgi:hypothetical protein
MLEQAKGFLSKVGVPVLPYYSENPAEGGNGVKWNNVTGGFDNVDNFKRLRALLSVNQGEKEKEEKA